MYYEVKARKCERERKAGACAFCCYVTKVAFDEVAFVLTIK